MERLDTDHPLGITGKAQVWSDGKLAGEKLNADSAGSIVHPAGPGTFTVSFLIEVI